MLITHYYDKMSEGKILPKNIIQNVSVMVRDYVSQGKNLLLQEQMVLPASKNKFLVDSESSHLKAYVEDTNVGVLCSLNKDQVTQVYNSFIEKSNIEARSQSWLSKGDHAEIIETLEKEMDKLKEKSVHDKDELKKNEGLLDNIKNNSFLNNWHENLVYEVLKEALKDSNHVLHKKVQDQYKIKNELDDLSKDIIRKKLKILWNRELVSRTLEKIVQKKVITNEDYRKDAIQGLLESINLWSEYIVDSASRGFDLVRELYGDYSINDKLESTDEVKKYIVKEFSAALLIEEEQSVLKEMLLYAIGQKQNDIALLLICNEVDHEGCKVNLPKELAPLEIKRLYKNMPKMIYRDIPEPVLSLKEIKEYFPDEDVMNQIASCILEQEERLTVGTPESTEEEKKKLVNKNIKEILDEYPFYIVWYYKFKTKKSKLEKVERALSVVEELDQSFEESAGYASAEPFLKELGGIEKKDDVRLNRKFFEKLHKIKNDESGSMLTFEELAGEIIGSKKEHINNEKIKAANIDLSIKDINTGLENTKLKDDLKHANTQNQSMATRLTSAEAKAEEERVRAEAAESKAEAAEARSKATGQMFSEAAIRGVVDKVVSDQKLQDFLIDQFTSVILYENVKNKFHDEAHKCVQLRKELTECEVIVDGAAQNPKEMSREDIFERRLNLVKESDKLDEKLKKLNEESAKEKPTFKNEKIEEFKGDVLTKAAKAKKEAKNFEQMLQQELEKLQRVEEEKLQMQVEKMPDFNMSAAKVQSHKNIASKIA